LISELDTKVPAVHSFFRGVQGWPTADLAKLLALVHGEIHTRAEHHKAGGGVEAELAARKQGKLVDGRPAK
jgi:hypothetical protein